MTARDRLVAHLRAMNAVPTSQAEGGDVEVEAEALADALMPFWECETQHFTAALAASPVVVKVGYGDASLTHWSWSGWRTAGRGELDLVDDDGNLVCTVAAGQWTRVYEAKHQPWLDPGEPVSLPGWPIPTDQRGDWMPPTPDESLL